MHKTILSALSILTIPLASAQIEDMGFIIEEPWFVFISLFAIFFAITYAALHKTALKRNVGAVAVIALVVSFLATAGLFRDEFIPGFSVIKMIIIGAILAVGVFIVMTFLKAAYFNLGLAGVLIILGIFISAFNWMPIAGTEYLPEWLIDIIDNSLWLGVPLIIIGIVLLFINKGRD